MKEFSVSELPRVLSPLPVTGRFRRQPEDFRVTELTSLRHDGVEEHLYLEVEKTGQNTPWVAQQLAQCFELSLEDVSWAGMKDRHAVARQWFSLRRPGVPDSQPDIPGVRVLRRCWHSRKLRRGELTGNAFVISLCDLNGSLDLLSERLSVLGRQPVPNYFGEQRFGRNNLDQAKAWLSTQRHQRAKGFRRGLYLSVLRAWLFNLVLAGRVTDGSWNVCLQGEATELNRPTGPLWGRGRSRARCDALEREQRYLADCGTWLEALEHVGLSQDRRLLGMQASGLEWQMTQDRLRLSFSLPKGCYATMLLREICAVVEATPEYHRGG